MPDGHQIAMQLSLVGTGTRPWSDFRCRPQSRPSAGDSGRRWDDQAAVSNRV